MKLQELAVLPQTKQIAKVFESYFGKSITFESISKSQAHAMLGRVRGLLSEHRRTPAFHTSEQNPAYLKLLMLEQALTTQVSAAPVAGQPAVDPQKQAALQATQVAQHKRQIQDAIKAKQAEIAELQKQMNNPTMAAMESRRRTARRLAESEVQQAQVILASQDMVDQVQRMIEQVTSMQFKDLPALVDQIRNEIGYDQATKFNADATAALGGMVQNLQQSKIQLETAMGTVTGQAPVVPGEAAPDVGAAPAPEAGAELPPEPDAELDALAADAEADLDEPATTGLGRERR